MKTTLAIATLALITTSAMAGDPVAGQQKATACMACHGSAHFGGVFYTLQLAGRNADKLLFGTDSGWWSIGKKPAPEFALIDELKLPKEVEDKICQGNAAKLFWQDKKES